MISHFGYVDLDTEIAGATRDIILSFYLPQSIVPFGRPLVHACCDPPLRAEMGFKALELGGASWVCRLRVAIVSAAIATHSPQTASDYGTQSADPIRADIAPSSREHVRRP